MDQPDIAATMFRELGKARINIKMISTSDIRISCVVSDGDSEQAVKLVHDVFHL
jgi:aspartate kinase